MIRFGRVVSICWAFITVGICLIGVNGAEIQGIVKGAWDNSGDLMRITLVGRDGVMEQQTLVHAKTGRFTLYEVHDGVFALNVIGSTVWSYAPIRVEVKEEKVQVESRRDPLLIPGEGAISTSANATHPLTVLAIGRATMLAPKSEGWTIGDILGNRFLMLQLFAISFVVFFPRYLKTLDKETLAELTGEIEQVKVDANEAIKALMGYEEGVEHEIIAPIPQ